MFRHRFITFFAIWAIASWAGGAEIRFPYVATVDVDGEQIRSGPGLNFYPTMKMNRGDRVTVHRHDPGGWFMIGPPPGSFSWIRADYIQQTARDRGILTANSVIVRVGSSISEQRDFSTFQRRLSKGDVVEILGEEVLQDEAGPTRMFKIKPPASEWRWIAGKAVVTAPSLPASPPPIANSPDNNSLAQSNSPMAGTRNNPSGKEARPPRIETVAPELAATRLDAIDESFRAMLRREPSEWDLASLERSYTDLEQAADSPTTALQVARRLEAISRYQKIQQDYREFYRLASEGRQRDAQLLTTQQQAEESARTSGDTSFPTAPASPRPGSTPANQPAQPNTPQPNTPQMVGAGIVQRIQGATQGQLQFVLVSPEGKRLAYLQPTVGVDLNRWVGQETGLYGDRSARPELNSDLILVRNVQAVQLRRAPPKQ